jgi:hypothetical protein
MPPLGFEPTIRASARPQTHALDRAATGIAFISQVTLMILGAITRYNISIKSVYTARHLELSYRALNLPHSLFPASQVLMSLINRTASPLIHFFPAQRYSLEEIRIRMTVMNGFVWCMLGAQKSLVVVMKFGPFRWRQNRWTHWLKKEGCVSGNVSW